ncbi:MAG: hypothetical protein GYB68_06640 [Chloroflexi bacterium]|nr:hypothetical protein [Chloroflexota bacterium]
MTSAPLSNQAITVGGLDEATLSTYQRQQREPNDSPAYAIGAALSYLRGGRMVDYATITKLANRRSSALFSLFFTPAILFGMTTRLWPGGPIAPRQQAALARVAARKRRMKVDSTAQAGTPDALVRLLQEPDTAVIVTLGWTDKERPAIMEPDGDLIGFPPVATLYVVGNQVKYPFGVHSMMLAAYDPNKTATETDGDVVAAPWGFINSWVNGHDHDLIGYGNLYWMPDEEFRRAWSFNILVGSHQMVVIRAV